MSCHGDDGSKYISCLDKRAKYHSVSGFVWDVFLGGFKMNLFLKKTKRLLEKGTSFIIQKLLFYIENYTIIRTITFTANFNLVEKKTNLKMFFKVKAFDYLYNITYTLTQWCHFSKCHLLYLQW